MKFNFYVEYDAIPESTEFKRDIQTMKIRARTKEQAKEIFEKTYPQYGFLYVSEYPANTRPRPSKPKKNRLASYYEGMEE